MKIVQSWSKGHTHQTTAWPVPHTCAQPWTTVFRPYWGSLSWHNCQVNKWGKLISQKPFNAEVTPLSASSTQHMWELLIGNRTTILSRRARGRWIMSYHELCARKWKQEAHTHQPKFWMVPHGEGWIGEWIGRFWKYFCLDFGFKARF